jgi:hypothetical protein
MPSKTSPLQHVMAALGIFALLAALSWILPVPELVWYAIILVLLAIVAVGLNLPYQRPKDIHRPQVSSFGVMVMTGIIIFFFSWVLLGFSLGALPETRLWAVAHANWVASWFPGYDYNQPLLGKSVYAMLAAVLATMLTLALWLFEHFKRFSYDRKEGYR